MSDLFEYQAQLNKNKTAPLAARMRPRNLDEFVGQEQIVGKGKLLRRAIEADQISSLIFYGPAGTGKTTLAQIIANTTSSNFASLSAVTSGVSDIRNLIKEAKDNLKLYGRRTVLFIDEIHRFNKGQQDALLPAVEDGTIVLIGATTENPYFEVNSALLSRSRIFRLGKLTEKEIIQLLRLALADEERGIATYHAIVDEDALRHIARMSDGDARNAYNALELAVLTTDEEKDASGNPIRHITSAIAAESTQQKIVSYDKSGDWHYDVISAFIKSMRGSDPDAVLYWLAKMIEAGEKPEFIARRIVICAAEDVGLADPQALVLAMAAAEAVHFVGWPEGRIPLAEAAVYVATAPKSNAAYLGIDKAIADIKEKPEGTVPVHLRDASYPGAKQFGHGKGYRYPHDFDDHYIKQQYLPAEFAGRIYYEPTEIGKERLIKAYLAQLKSKK